VFTLSEDGSLWQRDGMYQRAAPAPVWEGFEIEQPRVGREWFFFTLAKVPQGQALLLAWEAKLFSVRYL